MANPGRLKAHVIKNRPERPGLEMVKMTGDVEMMPVLSKQCPTQAREVLQSHDDDAAWFQATISGPEAPNGIMRVLEHPPERDRIECIFRELSIGNIPTMGCDPELSSEPSR